MARRLAGNWIDHFVAQTELVSSPSLFRQWAGIGAISGALERKVWMSSQAMPLYPNLYIVLTGPPGTGKTVVIDPVRKLWKNLKVHVSSSDTSRAAFVDHLSEATRTTKVRFEQATPVESFNSLLIASNELQVLFKAYDDFMGVLTDLWDCKDHFSERKRTGDKQLEIPHPHVMLLGGTTPSYINDLMSESAWDQGFASRVIFVFSAESTIRDPFIEEQTLLSPDLIADLKTIHELEGKYVWAKEAADAFRAWLFAEQPPRPIHPRLANYNVRRPQNLLKLAMIMAAAESDELCVELSHYQLALDALLEVERFMPDIFKSVTGADGKTMQEAWHYAYSIYLRTKDAVPEHAMTQFLSERAPIHSVGRMLEMLVSNKYLKREVRSNGNVYIPAAKRD